MLLLLLACADPTAGGDPDSPGGSSGIDTAVDKDTAADTGTTETGDTGVGEIDDSAVDSPGDSPVDSGTDSAIDTGIDSATDSAADSAVDSAIDSGIDSAADSAVDSTEEVDSSTDTGATPEAVADFTLQDLNPNSPRYLEMVSPRDYLEQVSGWYFIHAT